MPTPSPSPAPTVTTQLTVTDVLDFAATKPDPDTKQLFVVNQNELDIFGEIWVEAEVNVTWQIEIRNETTFG